MEMIYVNIETNRSYVRYDPIENGKVKLYSIDDNSGDSDITVTWEELEDEFELIETVVDEEM